MTFAAYWTRLVKRNPPMEDESIKMTITVASFKKSLRQSFDEGAKQERDFHQRLDRLSNNPISSFTDLFG